MNVAGLAQAGVGADVETISVKRAKEIQKSQKYGEILEGVITDMEDAILRRRWARLPGTATYLSCLDSFARPGCGGATPELAGPGVRAFVVGKVGEARREWMEGGAQAVQAWLVHESDHLLERLDGVFAEYLPAASYRKGRTAFDRLLEMIDHSG